MKKVLSYLGILCIVSIGISACGSQPAEQLASTNFASGNAVSGESAGSDGTEKTGEQEDFTDVNLEEHQFCSENFLYLADDDNDKLIQVSINENKKKKYEIEGLLGLLLVEKDRIYYTKSYWNGDDEEEPEDRYWICSVPIVSQEGTEKPLVEKEERLEYIRGSSYESFFYPVMDEESIYYTPYESSGELIRYDRKQNREEVVPIQPYYHGSIHQFGMKVLFDRDESIEIWDRETNEVREIAVPKQDAEYGQETVTENALYYSWYSEEDPRRPEVKRIDFATEKTTDFVTEQEIINMISEEAGISESAIRGCDIYFDVVGECLYLMITVEWVEGSCWNVQDVILSRELGRDAELQYEKELTECVLKYSTTEKGKLKELKDYVFYDNAKSEGGIEEICWRAASYAFFGKSKVYIVKNFGKFSMIDAEKISYISFDRETGAQKEVKPGMPEHYELYCDNLWEEDYGRGA